MESLTMGSTQRAEMMSLPPIARRAHDLYTIVSWVGYLDYDRESELLERVNALVAQRRGVNAAGGGLRILEQMILMENLTNARMHGSPDGEPPMVSMDARLYRNDSFELTVSNYIPVYAEPGLHAYLSFNRQLTYERRRELTRSRMCSMDYDGHCGARLGLLGTFDWAEICWWFAPHNDAFSIFSIRMRVSGGRSKRLKMRTLNIEQTKYTPLVVFDANERVLTLRGVSRPQNTVEFFRPVMAWVDDFVVEEQERGIEVEPCQLVFDLDYFNSITSKYIMGIIIKIKQLFPGDDGLSVLWYYTLGDEENRGVGEDMSSIAGIDFRLVPRGEASI